MRIFVLGLGEAGALYASGLVGLGHRVQAFDPVATTTPDGVERVGDAGATVGDAELVLSLVGAAAAERALDSVRASLAPEALFADMNTGAPAQKRALADAAARSDVPFVDAAIMSPVPRAGVLTPLLASGTGAERFVRIVSDWGVQARSVGPDAGRAAALKLLRSVFMKGLAGLVFEAVTAAGRTGDEAWIQQEIAGELGPDGDALVQRLLDGTRQHAVRRGHEMADVRDYLAAIDSPAWMTQGTIAWLERIADDGTGSR